jgi:2,4-dienoyl-CoA reductase-like NADH-dependent reductase (Old Yellow Enzyme family)/alpha-beta hydrolase superfamily lysophospholipase
MTRSPGTSSVLFAPATIGPVRLANRLVRAATLECMCSVPGVVDERYISLHENLARGGVGLIVTGNFFVHPLGVVQGNNLVLDSDDVISELARITVAVKRHGAPIFAQLNHGGRYANPHITGAVPLAPSAVMYMAERVLPRAMSEEEIETAIEAFVTSARRLRDAGFDGLEINAAHGYLVNQFLSGFTNRRRDPWGGPAESRLRFLAEIVTRTRELTGPAFPITVKLNGSDFMPGGNTLEECLFFARRLEELGVSGLTVSGGFKEKAFRTMSRGDIPRQLILENRRGVERLIARVLLAAMRRGARFSEGYFLPHAAAVKSAVTIPVTAVGGLRSLAVMEGAILDGSADLIGLSRPFVREPDLARRLQEGQPAATCVNCNRCTVTTALLSQPLRCHWKKEAETGEDPAANGIRGRRMTASDGFSLFYREAAPQRPRGAVLFLHGMSEHSGMYLHVISALVGAGFAVLAPDQRGRGRSVDGRWRRGDLHSVNRVLQDLDELKEQRLRGLNGLPLFIVGVSMGSIVAQMYALRHQTSLAGILLIGPPSGVPKDASPVLLLACSLLAATLPRFRLRPAPAIKDISRVRAFQNELDWDPWCYHGPLRARAGRELLTALKELETRAAELGLPILILYGTEDKIVSLREVEAIYRRWGGPDRTLTQMDGLYHDVLNEPERQSAIGTMLSWLSSHS